MIVPTPSLRVLYSLLAALTLFIILEFCYQPIQSSLLPSVTEQQCQSCQQWLIATMCAAKSQTRRNVIRATWQTLYQNPLFKPRFILSDYDTLWEPLIKRENETYGDLVKLEGLDPSPTIANRIKAMELFKHLVTRGEEYAWVSKIDDDAFLEADKFYKQYLSTAPVSNATLISIANRNDKYPDFDWPGGAFYTLSWSLVRQIVQIHAEQVDLDTPEDVRVGKYLHDANVVFDYVKMDREAFLEIPVAEARIPHKITKSAVLVHFLKDDETYLEVSGVFGKDGYTGEPLKNWTEAEKMH